MSREEKRKEIRDHHTILQAIKEIGAISELVEYESGHGYKYGVDIEVAIYGRNYGPGKKVGPYIRMFEYPPGAEIVHQGDWETNTFFIIEQGAAEVFVDIGGGQQKQVAVFEAGRPVGEMGVIAGVARAATVKAHHERGIRVLEVQRPALRILRKLKKFGTALDLTYRDNGRKSTLTTINLSEDLRQQLNDISEFKVIVRGHTICSEGTFIDKLYIIKDGWIERSSTSKQGPVTDHMGPGYALGMNALTIDRARWTFKATALGRTELLEISLSKLKANPALLKLLQTEFEPYGTIGTPLQPVKELTFTPAAKTAQKHILDKGLADANNLLLMDMDLCVRCGNCSLACHEIHGQSRLTRRGIHVLRPKHADRPKLDQSLLAPAVCLHCKDPECLTGCPTGAIARFSGGQVDIVPSLCIGCGDCATQCPYNSISLIPRDDLKRSPATGAKAAPAKTAGPAKGGGDRKGQPAPEPAKEPFAKQLFTSLKLKYDEKPKPVIAEDNLVAVKCNLCNDTPLNPKVDGKPVYKDHKYNCEENCPTGALMRVNPSQYFEEIGRIKGKAFRQDGSTLYGSQFGWKDAGKQIAHTVGILATLALCGGTMAGIVSYGLGTPLFNTQWFNLRWITGLVGLLGIVVVMLYPGRRQVWRKRAGALRYWMLAHAYAGVIAGVVLLLHGGTHLGGILTSILMISFDLVILTGLIGLLLYWIGPRTLTQIEGEPLLVEDLIRRRQELFQEIADVTLTSQSEAEQQGRQQQFAANFLGTRDKVLDLTTSLGFLMRQYFKRESLDDLLKSIHTLFEPDTSKLDKSEKDAFLRLLDAAVIIRRIDALIYIHRALKIWLPPHVISTSVMLATMLIHIVQVTYYLWK